MTLLSSELKPYKIGETYIKFDFEYSERSKKLVREAYIDYVRRNSASDLKMLENLIITIEFDKGSTKAKVKLFGTIAGVYMFIANYGSFRAGVREIIKDVKWVSEVTVNKIQDAPQIDNHHIIRFERRLGIPGRLNDIYKKVDSLEKNVANESPNQIQSKAIEIKQEIADILEILDLQTRHQFLNDLPVNISNGLPQPSPANVDALYNRYGLKPKDETEVVN